MCGKQAGHRHYDHLRRSGYVKNHLSNLQIVFVFHLHVNVNRLGDKLDSREIERKTTVITIYSIKQSIIIKPLLKRVPLLVSAQTRFRRATSRSNPRGFNNGQMTRLTTDYCNQ